MKKVIMAITGLLLTSMSVWGANRVVVKSLDSEVAFKLSTDQELAGLAVALKFADKDDDVTITGYDFKGTRLENLALKEAIIDNLEKTVVVYGIVLEEKNISPGEGPIVNLTVAGTGKVEFALTTVGKQEGITLVTPLAKEVPVEFEQSSGSQPNLPVNFGLLQNFPNPFNATTQIRYSLPEAAQVKLEIVNVLGQRIKTLVDEFQTAGHKQVIWDGTNHGGDRVASGVYFYRIEAGKFKEVQKMSLLK